MEIINDILKWPSIIQGILGSAIFAFGLWFLKFIYIKITNSFDKIRIRREYEELTKYYIHEYFVNTRGLFYFTQGYLLVIYKVLNGLVGGIVVVIFWVLITRIIDSNPFIDIFFGGIIIYKMSDLKGWFYPKLSKGEIENYDKEIVKKIRKNLLDERSRKIEINKKIKNAESTMDKLSNQLSDLRSQLEGENITEDK